MKRKYALLRVVTANVNGIRAAARRGGLQWLMAANATVITMQEVRASDAQIASALAGSGFEQWHQAHAISETAGRSGVSVISTIKPIEVRHGLDDFGPEGRWIEVDLPSSEHGIVTVISAYVHTGEAGTERQDVKIRFMDAMQLRLGELAQRSASGEGEALVTGDLNVAHRELDIKNWKGNLKKSGFLPDERAYFDRWLGYGWDGVTPSCAALHEGQWVDLGRKHGGDGPGPYTWWSWRGKAFDNDAGWRIDYQLATSHLAARCESAVVGRAPSYAERWSDHAPLTTTFN